MAILRNRWERWAPATGILYVALFVIAFVITGDGPGDSDEEILSYYADSGNRATDIAAFFLIAAGVLLFLWFLVTLRSRLRSAEEEPKTLSVLAFAGGLTSAALLLAADALFAAVSGTVEFTDEFRVDPNTARLVGSVGYLLFVGSTMAAAVLVAATSTIALKGTVLPKWFGWVGFVAALALLVAIFFFPIFVLWAWVLVMSVLLLLRAPVTQPEPGPTAGTGT